MIGLHTTKDGDKQSKSTLSEKEEKIVSKLSHKRQKTQINFTNSLTHTNSETDASKDKINTIQYSTSTKENYSSVSSNKSDESSVISFYENTKENMKENVKRLLTSPTGRDRCLLFSFERNANEYYC